MDSNMGISMQKFITYDQLLVKGKPEKPLFILLFKVYCQLPMFLSSMATYDVHISNFEISSVFN